jgi:hypothetical protein
MSSQASTRRRVQPPARFPKDETPPVLPVGVPDNRAPTDSTPMEAPAVTSLPPTLHQDEKIPSNGPTPLDEGPSVPVEKGTPRGDALFTFWSGGRDCKAAYR